MISPMRWLLPICAAAFLVASARPASADVPVTGSAWPWPKLKDWLDGAPVATDTAGKIVVHWFCKPKVEACKDDLARIYNMREQGNVYVIAYVLGSKRDGKKLDPVRAEVGAGAVGYGKSVTALVKQLGFGAAMPVSVVVDTDGKIALITTTGDLDQLDARDAKVAELVKRVTEFTTKTTGPTTVQKVNAKFELAVQIQLSSWLAYNNMIPEVFIATLPPDVTCDAKMKRGQDVTVTDRTITAKFMCASAVKGAYELRASLRFGYDAPNKATGVGEDTVSWKFEVAP